MGKVMISKSLFVECVDAIEAQTLLDRSNSATLCSMFSADKVTIENSLYKPLIKLLQESFPRDKDGFCQIEHFCFGEDFGRESEVRNFGAEELYDTLILEKRLHYDFKNITATRDIKPFGYPSIVSTHKQ